MKILIVLCELYDHFIVVLSMSLSRTFDFLVEHAFRHDCAGYDIMLLS